MQEQAYKDKDSLERCVKEHPGDISKARRAFSSLGFNLGEKLGSRHAQQCLGAYENVLPSKCRR